MRFGTESPTRLQMVRKLLVAVTAAATDPQLGEAAQPFAHGVARHMAMMLTAGLEGAPTDLMQPPEP